MNLTFHAQPINHTCAGTERPSLLHAVPLRRFLRTQPGEKMGDRSPRGCTPATERPAELGLHRAHTQGRRQERHPSPSPLRARLRQTYRRNPRHAHLSTSPGNHGGVSLGDIQLISGTTHSTLNAQTARGMECVLGAQAWTARLRDLSAHVMASGAQGPQSFCDWPRPRPVKPGPSGGDQLAPP